MMISMTGFGKGVEKYSQGKVEVEIKTFNHKTLSVTCNPFNDLFLLEEKLQKAFEGKIHRGKVFVRITKEEKAAPWVSRKIKVHERNAKEYLAKIKNIQKRLKLTGEVGIRDLIKLPGIIEFEEQKKEENIWPYAQKAIDKAVSTLLAYRSAEGSKLAKDFNMRLGKIEKQLGRIKKYGKESVEEHRNKLIRSAEDVMKNSGFDKNKLETEVALFARSCDITEEIIRLEGHLAAYRDTMKSPKEDAGKKLDFIAQEMQREANTIGAKSGDYNLSKAVIEIKSQIEKIREQVKNIE
jgi:uncharacterized protein (TIGR00255 family)